ncbi:MAG TPA: type II secretion system F family protein [Kineosporiaceae bacterium]|nr:type II secretion system F family protein [Kineosporiaceae bacterium]
MPKFTYTATAADGSVSSGVQKADTLAEARLVLLERQLWVSELSPRKSALDIDLTPRRIKRIDLMHLSRQLAAFLRAGIPILDALDTLAAESDKPAVRSVLTSMGEDLRAGSTMADAVDRHPNDFPPFFRGILRSAEVTGRLDVVLDQLSVYLERDVEARRKIKSALTYPAIVAVLAVVAVVVLSVFVLPKFEDFFTSLGAELPLATRILLSTTQFLARWWWLIITLLGAVTALGLVAVRTPGGKLTWHRLLLRVPLLGETIRFALIERFTRVLASMVGAGVPLPEAMRVATESLNNRVFTTALGSARTAMIEGAGLAQPLAATHLFPGVASQMIRVGENTGTLDTQLEVAATFYERELNYKIEKLTTLIEPIVVLVMGSIVGFVAIALVSAMYGIFRTANLS